MSLDDHRPILPKKDRLGDNGLDVVAGEGIDGELGV